MSDINIVGSLKVDTGDSAAKIGGVKGAVNETGEALGKASGNAVASTGHFSKLKDSIGSLPGPLGQAGEGVGKLGGAFKALLANPVGLVILAIVAALAALYKAFTNSFEGGQKMEQVFAGIKAAGQALIDNIMKLGGAIIKAMNFDFSGAIADIKDVKNEAVAAYTQMAALTKQSQQLHKEQLANDLDGAKRAAALADLKEKASDESIPVAQRKKAAQDLYAESLQNSKDDLELAKRTADNKIAMLTLQKDGARKNADEITKIQIEQINGARENSNELRAIGKLVTKADKDEEAARKEIHTAAMARGKEAAAAAKEAARLRQEETDRAVADARKLMAEDLKNADAKIKDQEAQNAAAALAAQQAGGKVIDPNMIRAQTAILANSIIKQDQEATTNYLLELAAKEAAGKEALAQTSINAANLVADAVGKATVVGKGISVATALINTYQGIAAGVKLGYPMAIPAVIAAAATGFAAVKNILSVKVPGKSSAASAATPSVASIVAPLQPAQASTTLDQKTINTAGNAAAGGVNRSYVLDSDNYNAAERTARLSRAARIG